MFSLRQPVRRLGARLSESLASSGAIAKIERIADWFPAAITNCFCFELELAEASSTADFAFLCNRDSTGVEILAGLSSIQLPHEVFSNPFWVPVGDFCRKWMVPDNTSIRNFMTHLWVELDSSQHQHVPIPCIFFGMPRSPRIDFATLILLIETLNHPVSNQLRIFLKRFLQSVIPNDRRLSLGLMFSRNTDRVRFVFHGIEDHILRVLSDLEISDRPGVNTLIADLKTMEAHINLAVDIGESIGPRVGIECQFADQIRIDQPYWTRLLNHLVSLGCCAPAKRDALLRWPGGSLERFDHLLRPAKVARKIKHVKMISEPGSPLQAKAYLFSILG